MGIIKTIINGITGGSTVTINGQTYTGKNITVVNGKVTVDGKEVSANEPKIEIRIEGNVGDIETGSGDVEIKGSAKSVKTASGDVTVGGGVQGDVSSTSGDIDVSGNVSGRVSTTSGDVNVEGSISGAVSTMSGSVLYRK